MPRAASSTTAMALPNNPSSFTTIGAPTTTDNKTMSNPLNSSFGSTNKTWGNSNIWGSGSLSRTFASRAATRDDSVSREGTMQNNGDGPEHIEGKTGSGSLVENSTSEDWSYRSAWGAKRSLPSTRSISQSAYPEQTAPQQRSASNAGLPQNFPSSIASRPAPVNLSLAPATKPGHGYGSILSNGRPAPLEQQPPLVYTKFDRPSDPNARKPPDSAKGGMWADYSPTDDRNSFHSHGSNAMSMPSSRNGSQPPSRHCDDPPVFMRPEYSRSAQRQSHSNSRTPSLSSQGNSFYCSYATSNADPLAKTFDQLSLNGDGRPSTSHRPTMHPSSPFNPTTPAYSSNFGRSMLDRGSVSGAAEDADTIDINDLRHFGPNALLSPDIYQSYTGYPAPAFNGVPSQAARDLYGKQGPPFTNGSPANHLWDSTPGARAPGNWSSVGNGLAAQNRSPAIIQSINPYLDPSAPQGPAASLRHPYPPMYGGYGLPNHLALDPTSPYMPFVPATIHSYDPTLASHDPCAAESVLSAVMFKFKNDAKSKHWEIKEIYGHIPEFSGDQHGSRFIQNRLECANSDEKERVFREIQPNAIPLMTDVFGNYVIQKFFEHGDQMHKKILANKMRGQVLSLSLQMYGCRVVQKALDHVLVDQQAQLVRELEGHVLRCVKDQNGNHVIQKAIERCPPSTIAFIIDAFHGQVQHLSIHPYGCRVIQRCLERCEPQSKALIMHELMEDIRNLISDQYGNYVVQHVVEHDEGEARNHVLAIVARGLETYSKHKFASNVVERCLTVATPEWRRNVLLTLVNSGQRKYEGEDMLVSFIKDNFGNYVIQKLLDTLAREDYHYFVDLLQPAMSQAKRSGCGKQVLSIERKMHRFQTFRPSTLGPPPPPFNSAVYTLNLHPPPPPTFSSNFGSAATTPPPLTTDTSLQSSAIQSVNGDAVEGATAAAAAAAAAASHFNQAKFGDLGLEGHLGK